MKITFEELRRIKHSLSSGSIQRIAEELNLDEQTVRNYFSAHKYSENQVVEWHLEPGPGGGIIHLDDTTILDFALQIINEHKSAISKSETQPQQNDQGVYLEEPTALYSTFNERESLASNKPHSRKKTTTQLQIFKQMETLRIKLKSIPIPTDANISQLANEVNNP